MIEHALFPTLVVEDLNVNNDEFKELFFNSALNHFTNGYSNEFTGNLNLQTEPNFRPIYEYVSLKAKEYVATLKVNPDTYDFNIVKSWLNCLIHEDNPVHSHADAHFCFAYYLNVPEDIQKCIRFFQPDHPNDLYVGMLEFNVNDYTMFNSLSWGISPKEGTVLIFPGHLKHHVASTADKALVLDGEPPVTSIADLHKRRICLAGDIVLTLKEKTNVPLGIQPIKNWRAF